VVPALLVVDLEVHDGDLATRVHCVRGAAHQRGRLCRRLLVGDVGEQRQDALRAS
jgi:hypothetical protein